MPQLKTVTCPISKKSHTIEVEEGKCPISEEQIVAAKQGVCPISGKKTDTIAGMCPTNMEKKTGGKLTECPMKTKKCPVFHSTQ